MIVKLILSIRLLNIKKEKNHSLLKVEEDTIINREVSEDKKNQFLKKKLKSPKRLL